jgi:hypothetical protein
MPFVGAENPNARYAVSVWKDGDAEEDDNYYTTKEEAEEAFDRLQSGGQFAFGALYDWVGGVEPWRRLDEWPDDFED